MKKITFGLIIFTLVLPVLVSAQLGGAPATVPSGADVDVMHVLDNIVNWLFSILLIVAVIYLIIAAYYFVIAQGDSDKISKARTMILYALIGVAVAFLAKGLVTLVERIVRS